MKKTKFYIILFFILSSNNFGQNYTLLSDIGDFDSANSFSINQAGILYVTDTGKSEIIKLDTLGNILKKIGGFGWQESSFDYPSDIFGSTLNVYVADQNNDRIQIFDKDLNFLSSIKGNNQNSEHSFRYPSCVSVSDQGDLFILDSDNTRILKYNLRGEYLLQIGGFDAGNYSLSNPIKFALTQNGNILVIDNDHLVLFDQFGNGISKTSLDFKPSNVNSTFNGITLTDGKNVFYSDVFSEYQSNSFKIFTPDSEMIINDAIIFKSKLYILTPSSIQIFLLTE